MSSDIAIKVENLSKCYQIYEQPRDRLKQFVMPRLQRGLGKQPQQYYREFWALKDVSFEVKKGETVGIIGRNGSGKSTLLQIICGTLNPTGGSVTTHGRIAALLELGSGFNPDFTGRENVYMNAAVLGLSNDEIDQRFDAIAAFADIGEFIEQPVKTYSSGMMMRLAFSVQAAVEPDILVIDEALSVGDEKFQRKCFALLESLKRRGTSIIFVSHSGPQVTELCNRALLIMSGELIIDESASEAVRLYQRITYASPQEQINIINSIKEGGINEIYHKGHSEQLAISGAIEKDSQEKQIDNLDYDPKLVPDSTVVYEDQGALIQELKLVNDNDILINVVKINQVVKIILSGIITSEVEKCYFAVHINSITGQGITAQRYPAEGLYVDNLRPGNKFELTFSFRLTLLAGTYFIGGGVWHILPEFKCAHRIMDASMFRVINENPRFSLGFVDLREKPAIFSLTL